MSRARHQLDWDQVAGAGDLRTALLRTPNPPAAAVPTKRRRSRRLTVAVLLAWLAWEAAGAVRAVAIGSEVLPAMWSATQAQAGRL